MTLEAGIDATLVQLDDRRRLALGKIGRHSRYLVREQPDGTLIFEPAVVMTELQAKLLQRPDIQAQIAAYEADPAAHRRPRRRRHEPEGAKVS